MRLSATLLTAALAFAVVLPGCSGAGAGAGGGGSGGGGADEPLPPYTHDEPVEVTATLSVTGAPEFVSAGGSDYYALLDHTDTTVELGLTDIPPGGDVYFVFSNPGVESAATAKSTRVSASGAPMQPQAAYAPPRADIAETPPPLPGRPEATDFNRNAADALSSLGTSGKRRPGMHTLSDRRELTVGSSTDTFAMDYDGDTMQATLRYEDSADGVTLRIWVPGNAFEGGDREHVVTQSMVDAMGQQFLAAGADNDIYDWVRGIYGAPWGTHSSDLSNLIPESSASHIDILLYDIDGDNQGGTLGYYWAKDNYAGYSWSNERLMFYMDSVYYADGDTGNGPAGWSLSDYYPAMQISTLAHEFQHMIHWYQKPVLRTSSGGQVGGSDTWVNEMLSLMAEDFVSQRLQDSAGVPIAGPRGVTGAGEGSGGITAGRLPGFNYYNDWPVTQWYGSWIDYSAAYAFGAFLARNFGGEDLIGDVLQSPARDRDSIEQALAGQGYTALTFEEVFRLHPVAVFLSDAEAEPAGVTLNLADDLSWFDGGSAGMQLGQIDHYNYVWGSLTGPWTWASTESAYNHFEGTHTAGSSIYIDAGSDGSADQSWKVTLPPGVYLNVVVKG
jgi:hypothetical protein